jgi:CRP/FNR family cyclic AMP-dependent transcriptional regulator
VLRKEANLIMRGTGWLSRQPRAFQDRLLARAELSRYPADTTIYNLGDRAEAMWGLVEGELTVLMAPEAASPHLVHVAQPGFWVGDTALITETPTRAGLIARRECWMLRLTKKSIDQLANLDAQTWRRIAQNSIGHLDYALSVIAGLTNRDTRARVAMMVRRLANTANEYSLGQKTIRVSHEELGEMVNLTRNALAPILKELEAQGLIRRRYRAIDIPDIATLDRYAASRAIKPNE